MIQPLSLIVLYSLIFTYFFTPRGFAPAAVPYLHFLVAALLPWLGIAEGVTRSSTALVENAAILRKLPLQSELLILVPNVSALIFEMIGLALAWAILFSGGPHRPQLLVLTAALLLQFVLQTGVGFIVAVLHVHSRDVGQLLGFTLTVMMYISPILYPRSDRLAWLFDWNPVTPLVGLFRSALIGEPLPSAGSLVFLCVTAAAAFIVGLAVLRRVQPALADWL